MMCCDWNTNDKVGGGEGRRGKEPNDGGVLGTTILLIEDRKLEGGRGWGKIEDALASQTALPS